MKGPREEKEKTLRQPRATDPVNSFLRAGKKKGGKAQQGGKGRGLPERPSPFSIGAEKKKKGERGKGGAGPKKHGPPTGTASPQRPNRNPPAENHQKKSLGEGRVKYVSLLRVISLYNPKKKKRREKDPVAKGKRSSEMSNLLHISSTAAGEGKEKKKGEEREGAHERKERMTRKLRNNTREGREKGKNQGKRGGKGNGGRRLFPSPSPLQVAMTGGGGGKRGRRGGEVEKKKKKKKKIMRPTPLNPSPFLPLLKREGGG